jgi:hypothetical protein
VRSEAEILAASCAMDNGRVEEAARSAATLPTDVAATKDLSAYAREALQRLRAR